MGKVKVYYIEEDRISCACGRYQGYINNGHKCEACLTVTQYRANIKEMDISKEIVDVPDELEALSVAYEWEDYSLDREDLE